MRKASLQSGSSGPFLSAGLQQRGKGRGMVVGGPAVDLGEAHRLEPECCRPLPTSKDERDGGTDCRERQ